MPIFKRERALPLRVSDIMSTPPIVAGEMTSIVEIARIMNDNNIGSVMIVDSKGILRGIITERDIIKVVAHSKESVELPAYMVMSENPLTVTPETPIERALEVMRNANVRHLPVVDKSGKPVGMMSLRDIVDSVAFLMMVFKR
ncbi:MAG: CBS domain-containing protein [Thermoprotei archaeon]|nr:CBS domain-containing protein [Thermoprotei archaeon]